MNNKKRVGLRQYLVTEAGFNISWSSVIAGVVTFFACLTLLSLIGSAIGFGVVDPTSSDPFSGVGTGVIVWTVIEMILAFAAGGFVAGVASRRVGVLHGFLTWATSVVLILVLLTSATASAISGVSSLIGSSFSVVGSGVASVGSGLEDVASKGMNAASESLTGVDTKELEGQLNEILKDTNTEELQPGYLQGQLDAAKDEILGAGKEVALNPEDSDQIIESLTASLRDRGETIANAADKEAIAQAVSENTELSPQEAEEATNNIYNQLQTASTEAQKQIEEGSKKIEEAQVEIKQSVEKARVKADDATDTVASTSIWAFVGLAIAMVLTSMAGVWGSNFVDEHNVEKM